MKKSRLRLLSFILAILFSFTAQAQTIRTIAGNGSWNLDVPTIGIGGQALNSPFTVNWGIAVDTSGNVYFTEQYKHVIKKMNPNGILSIVAGTGFPGALGDSGLATSAQLENPTPLVFDAAGNLYVGDAGSREVRKITPAGIITRVAGKKSITSYGTGDGGSALNAGLGSVSGLAFDAAGNLYIADGNARVRKVNAAGIITTVVGSGRTGNGGNGGLATDTTASFNGIADVAIDAAGNIYVADQNNNCVRKISTTGLLTVFAGSSTGLGGTAGDGGPATSARMTGPVGLKFDKIGNLYISDQTNSKIRKVTPAGIISTIAGNGGYGFGGDGGAPLPAKFAYPAHFCFDKRGYMYIVDKGNGGPYPPGNSVGRRIRQIFNVDTFHISVLPSNVLCGNTSASFVANVRYAYYSFIYQWKINGVPVGTNSPNFASTTINNHDTVTCTVIDTAAGGMRLAISDTVIMTVLPPILPSLSIASSGDTVCNGLPVTLTATAINGGSSPIFQWYVNSIPRGTGPVFTFIPVLGDIVTCALTSNDPCAYPHTFHVDRPISVIPSFLPSVTVHADPDTVVAYWSEIISFFTNVTYGGSSPTYQWYNNSGPIPGATNSSYSKEMYGADTIYCVMHSNAFCAVPDIDTSEIVYITTGTLSLSDINGLTANLIVYPNPNNGNFRLKGVVNNTTGGSINVEIRNVLGQSVYKNTIRYDNGKVDVPVELDNSLPSGMYYLITGDQKSNRSIPFMIKK